MNIFNRILRRIRKEFLVRRRRLEATQQGIIFHKPNYIFLDGIGPDSIVIDVGCAGDADFSIHMMNELGVTCVGVDPTKKHAEALEKIELERKGKFKYLPLAVASQNGELRFHESNNFDSGSLIHNHLNMQRDSSVSYKVEAVTLRSLLMKLNIQSADFIKLDLEGAEYKLLAEIDQDVLDLFGQIFVEFHHHSFDQYSTEDTYKIVSRIKNLGYSAFSLDDHNYLFFKNKLS